MCVDIYVVMWICEYIGTMTIFITIICDMIMH